MTPSPPRADRETVGVSADRETISDPTLDPAPSFPAGRETTGAHTDRETIREAGYEVVESRKLQESENPEIAEILEAGAAPEGSRALAVPLAALPAEEREGVKLPLYSTRGAAPGPRGCWALNRAGNPCGAARRAEGDYCNAHAGYGVTSDPARFSALGGKVSSERRQQRAVLRSTLGISRATSPRGILKAMAFLNGEAIAAAALQGVTDPAEPVSRRAAAALRLLDAVDPPVSVTLDTPIPTDTEGVSALSLSELLSIAEKLGIEPA